MEINLEVTNTVPLPKDLFVSVRVGDLQKFSKASTSKAYRFPALGDNDKHGAKLEVYRRVGVCNLGSLDSGKLQDGTYELALPVDDSRVADGQVHYRVKLSGGGSDSAPDAGKAAAEVDAQASELQAKVKEVKDYLERHQFEQRLQQAMQAVLRERPEDPVAFVAQQLTRGLGVLKKVEVPAMPATLGNPKVSPIMPATVMVSSGMVMFAAIGRPGFMIF